MEKKFPDNWGKDLFHDLIDEGSGIIPILSDGRITSYNVCYTKLLRDKCMRNSDRPVVFITHIESYNFV